jgi:hypothetical protein
VNLSKKLLFPIALVFTAFALVACGGDDSTTDSSSTASPEDVTKSFLLALADGDGEAACSLASQAAVDEIEAQGTCDEAVASAVGETTDEDRAQVENATYEVSDETDTSASVTATREDGQEETFNLVFEDGAWKIDG